MNSNKEIEGTDCIKTLVLTQLKLYNHYVLLACSLLLTIHRVQKRKPKMVSWAKDLFE